MDDEKVLHLFNKVGVKQAKILILPDEGYSYLILVFNNYEIYLYGGYYGSRELWLPSDLTNLKDFYNEDFKEDVIRFLACKENIAFYDKENKLHVIEKIKNKYKIRRL